MAREKNVSIGRLSEWRERALAGAATALKERERDDRDDEIALQNRLPRFNPRGLQDLVKLGLMRVNIKYNRLAERPLRLRGSAFPSSQARGRQAESLDVPSGIVLEFSRRNSSLFLFKCLLFQTGNPFRR